MVTQEAVGTMVKRAFQWLVENEGFEVSEDRHSRAVATLRFQSGELLITAFYDRGGLDWWVDRSDAPEPRMEASFLHTLAVLTGMDWKTFMPAHLRGAADYDEKLVQKLEHVAGLVRTHLPALRDAFSKEKYAETIRKERDYRKPYVPPPPKGLRSKERRWPWQKGKTAR